REAVRRVTAQFRHRELFSAAIRIPRLDLASQATCGVPEVLVIPIFVWLHLDGIPVFAKRLLVTALIRENRTEVVICRSRGIQLQGTAAGCFRIAVATHHGVDTAEIGPRGCIPRRKLAGGLELLHCAPIVPEPEIENTEVDVGLKV